MKGICYIIGASGEDFPPFSKRTCDLVIACDGGYSALLSKGIEPDILIGDLDSFSGKLPSDVEIIRHPVIKDDTDCMLCIKYGIENGYTDFVILGGMGGGRVSHTYANIQSLAYLAEKGMHGELISDRCRMTVIKDGDLTFDEGQRGHVSVFAYGGRAFGVSLKGLKYSSDNITLDDKFPLGVSNSFIGTPSSISVQNGYLLVILENE